MNSRRNRSAGAILGTLRDGESETLLLGAHVSTAGGIELAPGRGAEISANVIQIFTKQVQRWAERDIDVETVRRFRAALQQHSIHIAGSHDSYLINLATPDARLQRRSYESFRRELARCRDLELDFLVTHPGNATDGDCAAGLHRNAEAVKRALDETGGRTPLLFEATAGMGTALGSSFAELAELLERVGPAHADRLGVCLDSAHLFAAGYDLVGDYDGVISELERVIGLERVRLFHLNDSKTGLGSRVDRHEHIARGEMGPTPFRSIMRDARFRRVPKVIETPKENDPVRHDRRNLRWLRRNSRD